MDDTRRLILAHLARYPGMEVDDCLKLLYQSEWGGGHLIEDAAAFEAALAEELALPGLFTAAPPAPVDIGGGRCRVHLSALQGGPGAKTLAALCAQSAARGGGSRQGFLGKLDILRAMAQEGMLPWPAAQVDVRLDAYTGEGCPPLHHSQRFKALYHPHYRLLDAGAALYLPVFAAADRALGQKPQLLLGIDGMCAAGKSSLAALLAGVYGCGVVHADDFFLQPHQRDALRLAQPGGNIDYERLAPVARQAALGRTFSYQAYNCQSGAMQEKALPAARLAVLEGAYCLSPQVAAPCDVRVFLSVDAATQTRRIAARSPQLAARFAGEWIPMENAYFAACGIREGCDVVLDTTPLG